MAVDAATQRAFTAGVKARILAKEEEEAAAAAAALEAQAAATSAPAAVEAPLAPQAVAAAGAAAPAAAIAPAVGLAAAGGAEAEAATAAAGGDAAAAAAAGAGDGDGDLRSPSAKRTVHNRVLTGMDDVWVGERRVRFESPVPGDAAASGRAFEALRSPAGAAATAASSSSVGSGGLDGTPLPPLATPAPVASTAPTKPGPATAAAATTTAAPPGDAHLVARIKSFFGAGAPPRKETAAQSAALAVSAGANSVNRFGFGLPDAILKQAARDGAVESQHTAPLRDLVVTVGILATAIIIARAAAAAAR